MTVFISDPSRDDLAARLSTVVVLLAAMFIGLTGCGWTQTQTCGPKSGSSLPNGPRQIVLPLTDDEKPMRMALWSTTDRTYKQATEALTRVKTNVAAKIKESRCAKSPTCCSAATRRAHSWA